MYRWVSQTGQILRTVSRDRRGVSALVFAVVGTALVSMSGFAIDVGVAFVARQALQANANAAALDAAYNWWNTSTGTEATAASAAQSWTAAHPVIFVSSIAATPTPLCYPTTGATGIPGCTTGGYNAMQLKETATIPTYFLKLIGKTSWTISATATAVKGGLPEPLNLMFVLDTTASMGTQTDDSGCKVPGISNPTKIQCAKYGVQLILKQLDPAVDNVGLMVFPGTKTQWASCGSSHPAVEPYGTSGIYYQLIHNALDTNYATAIGTLNDSSNLVEMVGDNSKGVAGCLTAPGGESTFYADAINAAQSALKSEGVANGTNVIIVLSDGEATATSSDMSSAYTTGTVASPSAGCVVGGTTICSPTHLEQQCNQAVYYATTAAAAGTWIYAIAYDSTTTTAGKSSSAACPTQSVTTGSGQHQTTTYYYDSPNGTTSGQWSPCAALQSIASATSKFFSTNSSCASTNTYTDVASTFQQVGYTLLKPRLAVNVN